MKALTYFFLVIVPSLASAQFQGLYGDVHGSSEAGTTYRLYAEFDSPGNEVNAVFALGSQEQMGGMLGPIPMELSVSTEFFQHSLGVDFGSDINLMFYSIFPQLEYDSWLTIGSNSSADAAVNSVGMSSPLEDFNAGNGFYLESYSGGSWYVNPGENALAVSGEDGLVLLGQFTVVDDSVGGQGDFAITLSLQWEDIEGNAWQEFSTSFNSINLQVGIIGCTDNSACNFDSLAVIESGECEYTDICGVCGGGGVPEGTCDCSGIAPELGFDCDGNCLSDANANGICDYIELLIIQSNLASGNYCANGTIWNDELGKCLPLHNCFADLDSDSTIGISDMLLLLAAFGYPCQSPASDFECGQLKEFHGYAYSTVQIGDQCWMSENLRTTFYTNGDSIAGNASDSLWAYASDGIQSVYGEGVTECDGNCAEELTLAQYGRLYNGYAAIDGRGLCPSEWHVGTEADFSELKSFAEDFMESGLALKASLPDWNGLDLLGFSALPGGVRGNDGVEFANEGFSSNFWTSTEWANTAGIYFYLSTPSEVFWSNSRSRHWGYSIRCIKDTE